MKNYGSWDQFNTNRRVHGGTQRKIRMLCEPLRFRPSHKLYILTAMSAAGSTHHSPMPLPAPQNTRTPSVTMFGCGARASHGGSAAASPIIPLTCTPTRNSAAFALSVCTQYEGRTAAECLQMFCLWRLIYLLRIQLLQEVKEETVSSKKSDIGQTWVEKWRKGIEPFSLRTWFQA